MGKKPDSTIHIWSAFGPLLPSSIRKNIDTSLSLISQMDEAGWLRNMAATGCDAFACKVCVSSNTQGVFPGCLLQWSQVHCLDSYLCSGVRIAMFKDVAYSVQTVLLLKWLMVKLTEWGQMADKRPSWWVKSVFRSDRLLNITYWGRICKYRNVFANLFSNETFVCVHL